MAKSSKRSTTAPAAASVRQLEKRLAALERAVESLQKTVGDLKYEVEQMVEA